MKVRVTITQTGADVAVRTFDKLVKKHFLNFFDTNCISEINNTQNYNAKDLDVVRPLQENQWKLLENSKKYSQRHLEVYITTKLMNLSIA